MIPSPSELQYFVEVASTLNISRAAERLGISQPSLSQAVRRLEDGLGVPLLIRGKAGVQLTRAGQRFVVQARHLLAEWDKLADQTLREETQVTGRYVIGCHPAVALYTLPHFLPRLVSEHPGLEVKLVHGLSRQVTDDIIGFKVDFGLVVNPTQHPDLVIKVLARDDVLLWTGPENAVKDVLICDPDLLQTQAILKQLERKGLSFRRTLTSGSLEVIASLVASGAGTGILPTRIAQRDPGLGLSPLAGSPRHQDRICLAYRADAQKSAASRTIAQAMLSCLG